VIDRVPAIAYHEPFVHIRDLPTRSRIAGWISDAGYNDTGRAFREIAEPLERQELLSEIHDSDGTFAGYEMSKTGQKSLAGS
jgi:hypothetical protein